MCPIYETAADLANEAAVVAFIEKKWKCRAVKVPVDGYTLDYRLYRNGSKSVVFALAEIKCRNNASDKYPDYIISLRKVVAAGRGAFLIVRFTDGIFWVSIDRPYTTRIGGRTDRNDPHDIERMACFDMKWFKQL